MHIAQETAGFLTLVETYRTLIKFYVGPFTPHCYMRADHMTQYL